MGHCDAWQIFALTENVAGFGSDCLGRCSAGGGGSRTRALDSRVHVRLIVITDVEHVIVSLEHARECSETNIHSGAIAALADHANFSASFSVKGRCNTGCNRGSVAKK